MNAFHLIVSALFLVVSILGYQYFKDGFLTATIREAIESSVRRFVDARESKVGGYLKLDLATIDMTAAQSDSKTAAVKINNAFKDVGFAHLVNIPGFKPDELLETTKWLFSQPLETKMRIARQAFRKENPNKYRGYFPVIPGGHSFKEAYEAGGFSRATKEINSKIHREENLTRPLLMRDVVSEPNMWPETDNKAKDEKFKDLIKYTFKFYSLLAKEVMHLMAEGLHLEPTYFDEMFGDKQLSTLRLLHYPTRVNDTDVPDEAKDGNTLITTGAHADTSFLTVLATFDNKGLQVKLSENGPWLDVPPRKDALLINIGSLLATMVNNKLKATNHRVIDLGTDRYSAAFFLEPNFDGDISKAINGEQINSIYKKYGPWMTNRTSQFAEYASTDFGIAD